MRLRNVKGAREIIDASDYTYNEDTPDTLYGFRGKWKETFGNDHPLHIEVGMGKGHFITEMARLHPDINYIGIEKFSSVLVRAIQLKDSMESAGTPLPNLIFIRMDATHINQVFDENEISRIYLNFSDPWPKARHARRRLTSREFLARFDKILIPEGRICFKTDNTDLFDFSLEEIAASGWKTDKVTRDLHHSQWNEGNVMTEYEKRFSENGKAICRLECYR